MLRRSEKHGKSLMDIFTVEAYNRLRNGENFRLNLETMQLEEIPEEISIPAYDVVTFAIHTINGVKAVIIHDFLDIVIPFDWLLMMDYIDLVARIQKDLKDSKNK